MTIDTAPLKALIVASMTEDGAPVAVQQVFTTVVDAVAQMFNDIGRAADALEKLTVFAANPRMYFRYPATHAQVVGAAMELKERFGAEGAREVIQHYATKLADLLEHPEQWGNFMDEASMRIASHAIGQNKFFVRVDEPSLTADTPSES